MSDAVIEVANISKYYKDLPALQDISLTVNRGEIFGLIGPDGAGKSTLIHIITGVLSTKLGQVKVLGKNVLKDPESIKTSIGFLPQGLGLALAQELSVEENIDFFAEINHVPKDICQKRKNILLEKTQLSLFRERSAKNLSGGMKQKLALCCTLIHEPEIIFLDEPTTGVDPISRRDLWTLINNLVKEKNLTVFLTTSYMDEAARCFRVALMHKGKIIEEGQAKTLPSNIKGKLIQLSVNNQQAILKILKSLPNVKEAYPMGEKINIIYAQDDISSLVKALKENKIEVISLETITPSIEDAFLSKISTEKEDINEQAFNEFFKKDKSSSITINNDCPMIEVQNLEKRFGNFIAVNKINFNIKRGEIFGFLGPNGAGKTTTIKMLCGLFPPTSGKGNIAGLDLFHQQFKIKQSIGYMSQKFSLYRDLTVGENIQLYGGIYGVNPQEMKKRLTLILEIADLQGKENVLTSSLPMGIKQRLSLGCAIIHKPECVFLDEPTSGVDPIARRKFWDIIFLLSRSMGVTILVTTHYMDEAEHCDRLLLINKGNVVALGKAEDLKTQVSKEIGVLFQLCTNDPFLTVEVLKKEFNFCFIYGTNVHIYTTNPDKDINTIKEILKQNNIVLQDARQGIIPFEDVFVYFCQKQEVN